jgi:membrane protein
MRSGESLSAAPSRTARRTGIWVIRRTRSLADIILNTARGFRADRGFDLAASLAFATLIAAVPLLATFSLVLAAFFQQNVGTILDIVNSILPYHSAHVTDSLREFVNQSTAISRIGLAVLLVISVRLIFTVEGVFNSVWGAPRRRRLAQRVLLYTLVLLALGLILGSMGMGANLLRRAGMAMILDSDVAARFLPYASEFIALTLLYRFLPNARVRWGAAAIAGAVVSSLLELVRGCLGVYVHALSQMNLITGSITFILLTLISVYLVWVLILLGVELTHVLVTGAEPTHVRDALRIVLALSRMERASLPELSDGQGIPASEAKRILTFLRIAKLVEGDKNRGFALTRPAEEISVAAVAAAIEKSHDEFD